jgi:NosR/NirI family nitrous oxide reductase transcriptional regulator
MNECFQCLECEVDFYDFHKCPPLVAERKRALRSEPTFSVAAE